MAQRKTFDPRSVPLAFWRDDDVQTALARHDIGTLFRTYLHTFEDCTQTQLGLLTEHDRSEISNWVRGARSGRVGDIDVLTRIADGLNMPDEARVLAGLAPASVLMSSIRSDIAVTAAATPASTTAPRPAGDRKDDVLDGLDRDPGGPTVHQIGARSPSPVRSLGVLDRSAPAPPCTSAPPLDLEREISMTAHESSEHAAFAAARAVEDATIEQLQDDIASVARRYPTVSPVVSFAEAKRVRNLALAMLDRTGRPAQEADLYLTIGQSCGILASVAFDLGYTGSAAEQARSAYIYGQMIGHNGLSAWALGMRALIGYWSDRPLEALTLTDKGLSLAPAGTPTVRLHSIAARAHAHLNDAAGAEDSARLALAERERSGPADELHDRVGGEFSFDAARMARCLGSAFVLLGMAEPAIAHARHVLDLHAHDATITRMPKVESEAWIDLAHAQILGGHLDAAEDSLGPVFALEQKRRVQGVTARLTGVRRSLTDARYLGSRPALDLGARIEVFAAETAGSLAPVIAPGLS